MKLFNAILLAVAGTALAKGDKGNSIQGQCNRVQKLTNLVDLASNSTKLDRVTKGNATRAAEISSKASSAATALQTLKANATLMAACTQVFAVEDMAGACARMNRMERLVRIAANQTLLDQKTRGNATKAAELKAKASQAATQLPALQSNTTLTTFCAGLSTRQTCRSMRKLQREVALAGNTTALSNKFNGNATRISEFQAKASRAATKLATMQGNTTLTSACQALSSASNAQAAAANSTSGSGNQGRKSDASGPNKALGAMASLVGLLVTGLILL